ncbi:unnamed protein product [Alopecurus aequalis]
MLKFIENRLVIFVLCLGLALADILSSDHVLKTIKTEDGDVFKCIDINTQPALEHPLLKNHKIQMKPTSYSSELHNWSLSELAGIKTVDDIYGSQVSINVYEPKVKEKTEDFSASWVLMGNNDNKSDESIAVGSVVWPSLYGDNFARFHTSWHIFVAGGKESNSCYDHRCPGFVQVSPSVGLGGRVKPVSVYNGPQYEIQVLLFKDLKTTHGWLAYGENKTPIGYWPASLFTKLKDKSNIAFWGGHLRGPTVQSNFPEMGSGHFASEGFGKAAFVRDIKIVNGNNTYATPNIVKTIASSSRMTCYTVDKFGQDDHGMHVYYGGPAQTRVQAL